MTTQNFNLIIQHAEDLVVYRRCDVHGEQGIDEYGNEAMSFREQVVQVIVPV